MQWLVDVLNGKPTSEAAQHLRGAFMAWSRSGGHSHDATGRRRPTFPDLARCCGLPTNPAAAMRKLRDWHLVQASELVGADYSQRWQRAKRLHAAAQHFMGRSWPCWWALEAPPAHATGVKVQLWHAARAGAGRLPKTVRRYAQIIEGCEAG